MLFSVLLLATAVHDGFALEAVSKGVLKLEIWNAFWALDSPSLAYLGTRRA